MRHSTELFASVHACYILLGFFLFPTRVIILMYAAYWLAATDFLKSRQTAAVYLSLRGPCVSAFSSLSSRRICLGVGGGHYATSSVNSRFWKENADTDFWLGEKRSLEGKDKKELIFTETLCEVEGSWIDGTAFIEVYKRENSRSSKFHGVCFILSVHLECVWLATISEWGIVQSFSIRSVLSHSMASLRTPPCWFSFSFDVFIFLSKKWNRKMRMNS